MSCARGCCATQREHYLSVRLSAQATPSSKADVVRIENQDREMKSDCAAYRRLVKDGKDPGRVPGSAALEKTL